MIKNHSDVECIPLCRHRSEALWVTVDARIVGGELTILGQDLGDTVCRFFGGEEYEYQYTFDGPNTQRLLSLLSADGDPIGAFACRFSGLEGCAKLKAFCQDRGISYEFNSWVSYPDEE